MSNNTQIEIKNHKLRTKLILIYLILFGFKIVNSRNIKNSVTFQFPEFDYKEISKNELIYREAEVDCGLNEDCMEITQTLEKLKCIRSCINPSCYNEIYSFDELEPGEIDVRLNSFKGCVIQRTPK